MIPRRYRTWHLLLDAVGVASAASCILYVLYGHEVGDEEVANIWSGVSTELLGAWVTARAIEVWLRKQEQFDSARIRVVRSLRFFVTLATRCVEYAYVADIVQLSRERKWSARFFAQHQASFDEGEIADVQGAFDWLAELSECLARITHARSSATPDEEVLRTLKAEAAGILSRLEDTVNRAEDNVLEETIEHR